MNRCQLKGTDRGGSIQSARAFEARLHNVFSTLPLSLSLFLLFLFCHYNTQDRRLGKRSYTAIITTPLHNV